MTIENVDENKYVRILENFQPDVVGFSVLTPNFVYSTKLAGITKKTLGKNVKVIFGGVHPTLFPDNVLKDENTDVVVRGEGELTMLETVSCIKNNLSKVKGISYKKNKKIIHNSERTLIENLDGIPYPARHLLKGRYYFIDAKKCPLDVMITSRGCPFRCIFCTRVWGRNYRMRSKMSVVDEMEFLVEERGVKEIHVIDDIFNLNIQRAKDICNEIIKRNLDMVWALPSGIRSNKALIDEELAKKLHYSNCWMLAFGIESGDQKILNIAKKDLKIEEVKRAVKICRDAGIEELWGFFLMGLPGETKESIEKTIDLACELDLDVAKFHILVPFPGSEVYEIYKKQNLIRTNDLSAFGIHLPPVFELPDISTKELLEANKKAYRKFYTKPRNLIKFIKRSIETPKRGIEMFKAGKIILKYGFSK